MRQKHPRTPRLRRLLSLAISVTGVALLAGCGGGGGGGGGTAQDILKQAFSGSKPIHSAQLGMDLNMDLPNVKTLRGPVAVKLEGPFQSTGGVLPKFNFTLGITASGQTFTAGAASTGDHLYISFLGNNYVVSDQQFKNFKDSYAKAKRSGKGGSGALKALGIDPLQWLTNPQKLGTVTDGGTTTDHIQAGINLPTLLDNLNTILGRAGSLGATASRVPKGITAAQKARIQSLVKAASVDVYVGRDDHVLRRLTVNITLTSGSLAFDLRLSSLNQDQTIKAPANAQPLSDLLSRFSGGTGLSGPSAGSSSGVTPPVPSPPGGSSGSSSGGPAVGRQYLNCLEKAGQNIAAAQKCAALIGH